MWINHLVLINLFNGGIAGGPPVDGAIDRANLGARRSEMVCLGFSGLLGFLNVLEFLGIEDRRPKTEDLRPKADDRRPKTEDRRPKTEGRIPKT